MTVSLTKVQLVTLRAISDGTALKYLRQRSIDVLSEKHCIAIGKFGASVTNIGQLVLDRSDKRAKKSDGVS